MSLKKPLKTLSKRSNGIKPAGNFKDDAPFQNLINLSATLAQKMQTFNAAQKHLQRERHKELAFSSDQRKAQNRTKIQMGGLVLKSGLADALGITLGADLQLDTLEREKATTLLGALIEATENLLEDRIGEIKQTWDYRGEKALRETFLKRGDKL